MKIVIVGLGYVGLSNAVLLAQHNDVIGVDISQERVDALNARKSPIIDAELSEYLEKREKLLHLIYKGKIMQESIENRILDQLGVRKVEKVMTYFDAMVEKINKYKIDILKQENTKTDKSLIINYFLYRFLK